MENDAVVQTESLIEILLDQWDIIFAVLLRPVVQRQLFIFLIVLIVTWLLPFLLRRRQPRALLTEEPSAAAFSRSRRWLAGLSHLVTPALALLLLTAAIWILGRQGQPNRLLQNLTSLIWIWLVYSALLSLLTFRFGAAARPYQNRIVTPIFIVTLFLRSIGTLPGAIVLGDVTIGLGSLNFSIGSILTSLLVLYIFIVFAWVVKQAMVRTLPSRLGAEPGVIESVAALTRYTLLAVGTIVSLGILGLNFTSLAIVAGGLSVGIGIGLQDIVANFVSGLVLLFEQSLRPGDVVEIDGRISQVEKISLRATTVRTRTNEELIIPNATFTTTQVKNLTKTERLVQVVVPLGVSYKSDPELVKRLATATGLQHPLVLADPPPDLRFLEYGDSSINFALWVSVDRPEQSLRIKSDLYYMLWQVFHEHNIEIPFPQRDLNLGQGWEKLVPQ